VLEAATYLLNGEKKILGMEEESQPTFSQNLLFTVPYLPSVLSRGEFYFSSFFSQDDLINLGYFENHASDGLQFLRNCREPF